MKYSLRSLILNAIITVPFLVSGALAVWCAREVMQTYEEMRFFNGIRWPTPSEYSP